MKKLDSRMNKFTISEDLEIFIGSWNVGGQTLKDNVNLYEWLKPKNTNRTPDIYIIGLQEIVELNANYILLSSNQSKVDYWKNVLKKNLDEIDT